MPGLHLRFDITPQKFLEELTEAAYRVTLRYHTIDNFVNLELDLWNSLHEVIRKNMQVSEGCGGELTKKCLEYRQAEPWSEEAEKMGVKGTPLIQK